MVVAVKIRDSNIIETIEHVSLKMIETNRSVFSLLFHLTPMSFVYSFVFLIHFLLFCSFLNSFLLLCFFFVLFFSIIAVEKR